MRCNIPNCEHKARKATVGSWRDLGVCSCCAFELYQMNQTLGILSQYKKKKALSHCRKAFNPNPLGIPTRKAMLEIIQEKPTTRKELTQELIKRYGYSITKTTFLKHFLDLKQENLIKEVNDNVILNVSVILA